MRDNQSDDEGGWPQSQEYVSPWAPRDEGHDEGNQDGYGQTWYGSQDDYGSQSPYGQPRYGPDGYGSQPGYDRDGYREPEGYQGPEDGRTPGSHRADGGYGPPGWAPPDPPRAHRGHGGRFLVYIAVAALAASIGAGATVALNNHGTAPSAAISSNAVPGPHENAAGSGSSSAPLDRKAVAAKVEPGLVDITATIKYNSETAEGTGMIISSTGLVLTNNHVIDGATVVRATLADAGGDSTQAFSAKVVGYDATDDVALLRLQGASGLPIVSFGNSSQVSLGTPVLALGNAEGRGGATPAAGIINALNRSIQASDEGSNTTEDLNHMLQTNAQIQQGDSGGALANNAGQVIGMITAANAASGQGGSSGGTLGFAIPSNSALAIARQIASGRASSTVYIGVPGFLGVQVATSTSSSPQQQAADQAQGGGRAAGGGGGGSFCQIGNQPGGPPAHVAPIAAGALVLGVLCGTAAMSAGMEPGDVITSVAGQPITTPGSLTGVTARYHPGDIVTVIWVSLDGLEHTTRMQLGPGPAR